MNDQDEVVRALGDPAFYPHPAERVVHHRTHVSHVFVAGDYAYKLKRAVRYSFADFSTRELRHQFCVEELRLNRRLCAPLYLGLSSVTREADGRLALDGRGATVETLVRMRALPADGMLPEALAANRVTEEMLATFAADLARFHASPETAVPEGTGADPDALCAQWTHVMEDAAPAVPELLSRADEAVLSDFGPSFVRRHEALLRARGAAGRIRDGHGDLHAGNLCLIADGLPALADAPAVPPGLYAFDCLEFSPELRRNDVASEVAFLAMDLETRDRPALARTFVSAYVDATGDTDVNVLLPFYACYRACVRGMVLGLKARSPDVPQGERDAAVARGRAHFALATRLAWRAGGPAIVACCGLSGTGKTTLALALARATGFPHLSSDEMRKRRAGLDPLARTPVALTERLYRDEARLEVYRALAGAAEALLARGDAVIVDATFHRREERAPIVALAQRVGVPLVFLECVADEATIRERLEARAARRDASGTGEPALSDAGWEVYQGQRARAEPLGPDEPAIVVDTAREQAEVAEDALRALWQWRRAQPTRAVRPAG